MNEKLLINDSKSNNFEIKSNNEIEEMAVEFAKINCNPKGCYGCNLCDEYGSLELNCEDYLYYRRMAETFYNAGYRKQVEGEWIEDVIAFCNVCSSCRAKVDRSAIKCNSGKLNYCPNCGAKMVEN